MLVSYSTTTTRLARKAHATALDEKHSDAGMSNSDAKGHDDFATYCTITSIDFRRQDREVTPQNGHARESVARLYHTAHFASLTRVVAAPDLNIVA